MGSQESALPRGQGRVQSPDFGVKQIVSNLGSCL